MFKVYLTSRLVEILVLPSYRIYTVTDLPFMSSNIGLFDNSRMYQTNRELNISDYEKGNTHATIAQFDGTHSSDGLLI